MWKTESRLQEALVTLMAERTSFVVTQRISTVLNADKIIVLDDGKVAAEGDPSGADFIQPNIWRDIRISVRKRGGMIWLNRKPKE